MTTGTPSPSLDILRIRSLFDEVIGSHPVPDDVRTRDVELGGVPALEVTIEGIAPRGTLVWIHGGGYIAASPRIALVPAAVVARTSGMRVLSVDYRLAPEHPFPAGRDDVLRAIAAVAADGPYVLGGESAGGGLTLSALLALRDSTVPAPRAALVFSPVTDLTISGASFTTRAATDPVITTDLIRTCAAAYLDGHDARDPGASPLFGDLRDLPPLLIQAGGAEALLDDATRFALAVADAGGDVRLEVVAGRLHVFPSNADTDPEAERAAQRAGAFLREHLDA